MPVKLPRFLQRQLEADIDRCVPYAGHISHDVAKLFGGAIIAIHALYGTPFELTLGSIRNGRAQRINTLLRTIGGPDLAACFHLVRFPGATAPPQLASKNEFVRGLMTDYEQAALPTMFTNQWFSSVIAYPEGGGGGILKVVRDVWDMVTGGKVKPLSTDPNQLRRLEDAAYLMETTLTEYQPRRLALEERVVDWVDGKPVTIPFTEIGEALHLMRSAISRQIPHTFGALQAAVYSERVVFAPRYFRLNNPKHPQRIGAMIDFLNYPRRPRVGMFNAFLSAPYPLVLSNHFRFRTAGMQTTALSLVVQQMRNAGDKANEIMDELEDSMNRSASHKEIAGRHHFSLAVYADSAIELDRIVADAQNRLSMFGGAAPTRNENVWYNGAAETLYYSQLPGCRIFLPSPGDINSLDVACMASLDNYPAGHREGYWGASPIRFQTNGLTAFDYITHDEDVAHTLVIGRIGSGKSVFCGLVMHALEPAMGDDGIRLVIDKDDSHKMSIQAAGGTYTPILRHQSSGMAPLKALPNTPRTKAFLHGLYTYLIMRDSRRTLTTREDTGLMHGIAVQLKMPAEKRSMGGVREFLGYSDEDNGAGARFEKYCRGGAMGWLLDNEEHTIHLSAGLHGFNFTDIIPKEGQTDDGACEVAAAVITHQLAGLMDGRRIWCLFEECRFYDTPLKRMMEDYTLTGRKKELACWMIYQQPEHATDSAVGMAIVPQMRTKVIFPDANHNERALEKLELSTAAIRMLKTDMTMGKARRFLLWRQGEPTICEFDLSRLRALPILSSRPATVNLWDRVHADGQGSDEFLRRLANANQRRAA